MPTDDDRRLPNSRKPSKKPGAAPADNVVPFPSRRREETDEPPPPAAA